MPFPSDRKSSSANSVRLVESITLFVWERINRLPNYKFWTPSKLKEFADDNFKFDENGIKFFNRLENTVRKGEIARYEQFLIFSQCFQKTCTADSENQGLFGKGLNDSVCFRQHCIIFKKMCTHRVRFSQILVGLFIHSLTRKHPNCIIAKKI